MVNLWLILLTQNYAISLSTSHGCLEARLYYIWLLNTMGLNGTDPLVSSILGFFFFFPNRFVVCYYTIRVGWIHRCETWDIGGDLEVILRIWTVLRWDLQCPYCSRVNCISYNLQCFITIGLAKKFIQVFLYNDMGKPRMNFLAKPI